MGFFDRAGNVLKGLLRKPLEALEKSPEERQLDRELEEKAALERARANIDEMDRVGAKPARPAAAPAPAKPEPSPAKDEGNGRVKRRMGPE